MVRLGTKCPSMTSTWSHSVAASMPLTGVGQRAEIGRQDGRRHPQLAVGRWTRRSPSQGRLPVHARRTGHWRSCAHLRVRSPDVSQIALFDLDNTLVDRQAAFRQWAEWFVETKRLESDDVEWLVAADLDGNAPRDELFAKLRARRGAERRPRHAGLGLPARLPAFFEPDPDVHDGVGTAPSPRVAHRHRDQRAHHPAGQGGPGRSSSTWWMRAACRPSSGPGSPTPRSSNRPSPPVVPMVAP